MKNTKKKIVKYENSNELWIWNNLLLNSCTFSSESTIQSYSCQLSVPKKREMADALAGQLEPKRLSKSASSDNAPLIVLAPSTSTAPPHPYQYPAQENQASSSNASDKAL